MLTHRLLRGFYAVAISVALCLFLPSGTQAQDILKELEDAEPEQGHGHPTTTPTRRTRRRKTHQKRIKVTLATRKPRVETMRQSSTKDTVTTVVRCHMTRRTPASRCMASRTACTGSLVPIQIQREGSGTSWLPDATPHFGVHAIYGEWQTMYHALFNLVYDHQGGPRGGDKTFVNGMLHGNGAATARGWDFWFASDARA